MAGVSFFTAKEIEWKDISMAINGANAVTIQNVSYGAKEALEYLYGQGKRPIGIQGGNEEFPGAFSILKNDFDVMQTVAMAAGYDDVRGPEWVLTIKYEAQGVRGLQMDVITGVKISEWNKGMEQGAKKMVIALPFLAMGIETSPI